MLPLNWDTATVSSTCIMLSLQYMFFWSKSWTSNPNELVTRLKAHTPVQLQIFFLCNTKALSTVSPYILWTVQPQASLSGNCRRIPPFLLPYPWLVQCLWSPFQLQGQLHRVSSSVCYISIKFNINGLRELSIIIIWIDDVCHCATYCQGWVKRENYGRGRWTQTHFHTVGKDKEEQKASFNKQKPNAKNQGRQNGTKSKVTTETARQSSNLKARQSTKKKSSTQTWKKC